MLGDGGGREGWGGAPVKGVMDGLAEGWASEVPGEGFGRCCAASKIVPRLGWPVLAAAHLVFLSCARLPALALSGGRTM